MLSAAPALSVANGKQLAVWLQPHGAIRHFVQDDMNTFAALRVLRAFAVQESV